MKTGQAGIDLIKRWEGLHDGDLSLIGLQPKMCPAAIWTEGYGRAMIDPETGDFLRGSANRRKAFRLATIMTESEAEAALAEDLGPRERSVESLVRVVPLNQGQFDALVSFVYNLGHGALSRSTLLRKLNAGDYEGASKEFIKWNKSQGRVLRGLTARREEETSLFRG